MDEAVLDEAVASGRAFADLSSWRKVAVSGSDAIGWLNDLVSAEIADLGAGEARRSLLLSPTGQIRAEFTVARPGGDLVLVQDPAQRASVDSLLLPYVLSADVRMEDRSAQLALFAFPGRVGTLDAPGTASSAPSATGAGVDVWAPAHDHEALLRALSSSNTLIDPQDMEAWRIAAGNPRFGVDGRTEDLPEEAGFAASVSYDKGCFLGQEAVAKVRNFGHPRRLVVHLAADDHVSHGEVVEVEGEPVGEVTSASRRNRGWRILARINWATREGPFRTEGGVRLTLVPHRSSV
jgi:folate-binding protein YgfZ